MWWAFVLALSVGILLLGLGVYQLVTHPVRPVKQEVKR